jgi:hypothetical protein
VLEIARELTDRLEDEGIAYCHWKRDAPLSEPLAGTVDLDVLVDAQADGNVRTLLDELDFKLYKSHRSRTVLLSKTTSAVIRTPESYCTFISITDWSLGDRS